MGNAKEAFNFNTVLLGIVNFLALLLIGLVAWIGNRAYEVHQSDVKEQQAQHDAILSLANSVKSISDNMVRKSDNDAQITDIRARQSSIELRVTALELEVKNKR